MPQGPLTTNVRRRVAIALAAVLVALTAGASAARADVGTTPVTQPDGLDIAIGAPVTAGGGAAAGSSVAAVDDGDGTTRYCPATLGVHRVTVDLGRVRDITGAGATFSGEEGSDGSTWAVSTGLTAPGRTPLPGSADGSIVQGPLYAANSNSSIKDYEIAAEWLC